MKYLFLFFLYSISWTSASISLRRQEQPQRLSFLRSEFCIPDFESEDNRFETTRVGPLLGFIYRRLLKIYPEGRCSNLCSSICLYQPPCSTYYDVNTSDTDDDSCICFEEKSVLDCDRLSCNVETNKCQDVSGNPEITESPTGAATTTTTTRSITSSNTTTIQTTNSPTTTTPIDTTDVISVTRTPTSVPSIATTPSNTDQSLGNFDKYNATPPEVYTKESICIAYFGNSHTYYNDGTWLVESMLKTEYSDVKKHFQCLEGGATLDTLTYTQCPEWFDTNGIPNPKKWDFVVLQDQSRWPAYITSRYETIESLKTDYAPMLFGSGLMPTPNISQQFPVPVFVQTPAYKSYGLFGTSDLGGFDSFTDKVAEGYQEYAKVLDEQAALAADVDDLPISRIAPNGEAYRWLKDNIPELFDKLYDADGYHPSLYGTWLLACTLYITMTGKEPPAFNPEWVDEVDESKIPTEQEAATLLSVTAHILGLY